MHSRIPSRALGVALCFAALPAAALAQAGAIDAGFGNNGIVVTDLMGDGNASYFGWQAARNPVTGEVVVAAGVTGTEGHEQWSVMRFRADGLPDPTFGTAGVVRTDFQTLGADPDHPADVAFDTSGAASQHRILVAGYATIPDAVLAFPMSRLAVVAYRPDGTLDPSFAGTGVFLLADPLPTQALAIDTTADGKILVVGLRGDDGIVLRLLRDGSLDASYGTSGIATLATNGAGLVASAMQPDGGVVLGLQSYVYFPTFSVEFTLTRLSPAGAADASFGSGGSRTFSGGGDTLIALAARADGSLVGLHGALAYGLPHRLRAYAADATTTSTDTVLAAAFIPASMDLGGDGSVVLGGSMAPSYQGFAVARLGAGLALDPTFDGDGYATLDLGGYQWSPRALASPGGHVAVAGLRGDPVTYAQSFVLGRLLASGAMDTAFGGSGFGAIPARASSVDTGQDIAVHQADGKLVVLARTYAGSHGAAVLRYLPDGTPDPTFGQNGIRPLDEPGVAGVSATGVGLQSQGRIVVSGLRVSYLSVPPYIQWEVVAVGLESGGSLDPTFDGDGIATAILPDVAYASEGGLAIQSDDRIVVCTSAFVNGVGFTMAVARLQSHGAVDASFGVGGVARADVAGGSVSAAALAVAADGRIAVAGHVETYTPHYAVRVALCWFGPSGGLLSGPTTSVPGFGVDVAVDASGRAVVVAQHFWGTPIYDANWNLIGIVGESPWSTTSFAAVRVMASGALDTSFGTDGVAAVAVPMGQSAAAKAAALQPDGRIVLAGWATIQPTPTTWANDVVVMRLLANGSADASFSDDGCANVDAGPFDSAQAVLLQGDGKIVLVGSTHAYGSYYNEKRDVLVARLFGLTSPNVMVEALLEIVRSMAEQRVLNHGRAQSLSVKLQAALNQIDHGRYGTAANQIFAFRNEVLAFEAARILGSTAATSLRNGANAILLLLGANP